MSLNDLKVKNAKAKDKPYKITDGDGLYLQVTPPGGKLWRFRYRFERKEKLLAFGKYPDVTLLDARKLRDDARRELAQGVDPSVIRQDKKKDAETFELVAREWFKKFSSGWVESYSSKLIGRLEHHVFPYIGNNLICSIKAPELLATLRRIEANATTYTAHRVRAICGQIFRYGVATGRCERDPSADLIGALPPVKAVHRAAITEPEKAAELLRRIDDYTGTYVVKCALQIAPLVFVRPGELRHAEWSEIDLEKAEWSIAGSKMKMGEDHLVPLSSQVVEILTELKKLTGEGRFVFRTQIAPGGCIGEGTLVTALRALGYDKTEMTTHGFRAMARTILDEVLQVRPDLIEHQLAHAVKDPNGRAYNRTKFLEQRRAMMQTWADYLDGLKEGAKVLAFRKVEN